MSGDRDEIDGSVYANTGISLNKLLLSKSLDQLLKENREEVETKDENNFWYHKKISRESSETILLEGLSRQAEEDGLFLIRDGTLSPDTYALSLVCQGKYYHFQIQQKTECFFQIDDGQKIHGLDTLVTHYTGSAHGLPVKLSSFCRGSTPPHNCRKLGPDNLLHKAVLEGKRDIVQKILNHRLCPDVDAKNSRGSLALHDAAYNGHYDIVSLLLDKGGDVTIKDSNGHTVLHRACVANQPQIVDLLLRKGCSNSSERCTLNGWVPLHEAAMRGNLDCVKVLLDNDATPFPRNDDGETPLDLSLKYNRLQCVKHFETFTLKPLPTKAEDWFHPDLDRQGAVALFDYNGMRDGLFLIRPNIKHFGWHVLSLCHKRAPFNYVIRNEHYKERVVHYIDDGPYLLSLEHVVYHYSRQKDGLPCVLLASINPAKKIVDTAVNRHPLTDVTVIHPPLPEAPHLPPRPTSGQDVYASPNKENNNQPITPSPTGSDVPSLPAAPPPSHRKPEHEPPQEQALNEIPLKHIKKGQEIGQGEYGSVLKGTYNPRKGLFGDGKKMDVALKTFHDGSVENSSGFLAEARVMQTLDHKCILRLLGVCNGPPLMLVEEYVAMGSMLDYLLDHDDKIDVKTDLYLWAAQIAMGMKYLETKRLVHRDLAARNILLQSKKQIKISDFGLSRAVGNDSDYYKATHGGRWPIKWYAPESVNYGQFSHASDVWSYGVTLWEMFSFGEPPYGEMKGIEVVQFIEQGSRLEKPEQCPATAYDTMLQCWQCKPDRRPDFKALEDKFFSDDEYASIKDAIRRDHH